MATQPFCWLFMFGLMLTTFAGGAGALMRTLGCHFHCRPLSLQCPKGEHILLLKAQTRYLATKVLDACPPVASHCNVSCCQPRASDCVADMRPDLFRHYYKECWGRRTCYVPALYESQFCSFRSQAGTSFVDIHYVCVKASQGMNFTDSNSVVSKTVYAVFNNQDHVRKKGSCDRKWNCHVTSSTGTSLAADVMLINTNEFEAGRSCVTLRITPEVKLDCNDVYLSTRVNTPFDVTVTGCDVNITQPLWAILHSRNETLNLTCNVDDVQVTSTVPPGDVVTAVVTSNRQRTPYAEEWLRPTVVALLVVAIILAVLLIATATVCAHERYREKIMIYLDKTARPTALQKEDDELSITKDPNAKILQHHYDTEHTNVYGSLGGP